VKKLERILWMGLLCIILPIPAACTSVLPQVTTVLQKTQDASLILQQIDSNVRPFLLATSESEEAPTRYQRYDDAYQKVQKALLVVVRTAQGAEAAQDDDELKALSEFSKAYGALKSLLNEFGLVRGDTMRTAPAGAPQLDLLDPLFVSEGESS